MRIALVDDHPIVRNALRDLLAWRDPEIVIVGEASTAREAVAVVKKQSADVVVMDLVLDGSSGLAATREILREAPSCGVLVYSAIKEPAVALDVLAAGAMGYVTKGDDLDEIVLAVHEVARKNKYV